MTNTVIIMVVSNNQNISQRLKFELEHRKVCDSADIRSVGSNAKKLLEELILQKDSGKYNDYKLFIIDDSIRDAYEFAENIKHNYPQARIVLLAASGRPKLPSDIKSNSFYLGFRGDRLARKLHEDIVRKNDAELGEREREEKAEYLRAVKTEELEFGMNYIKKPIKDYGRAVAKIKQILVVGVYRLEDAAAIKRRLKSPEDIRKEKSEKAIKNIMKLDFPNAGYIDSITKQVSLHSFEINLESYGRDISKKEHAAEIVGRLKLYEKEAKQELEKIQKHIRAWEDRFPSIVQDSKAFEVVKEEKEKE